MTIEGTPWFIAKDVAACLGLTQIFNAVKHLKPDERRGDTSVITPGGRQQVVTINEPGLYRLVMRSRKPVAREFQDWVVRDVLPAIRKDGGYVMGEEKRKRAAARLRQVPRRTWPFTVHAY